MFKNDADVKALCLVSVVGCECRGWRQGVVSDNNNCKQARDGGEKVWYTYEYDSTRAKVCCNTIITSYGMRRLGAVVM